MLRSAESPYSTGERHVGRSRTSRTAGNAGLGEFERRTAKFQKVEYWDVWDAGEDEFVGNGADGYRLVGGNGVTVEGHGEGIRVLVNSKLDHRLLVKYLKGLVSSVDHRFAFEEEKDDDGIASTETLSDLDHW